MKAKNDSNRTHAELVGQAQAIADATAIILEKAERDFDIAFLLLKQAIMEHTMAQFTLEQVRLNQREERAN